MVTIAGVELRRNWVVGLIVALLVPGVYVAVSPATAPGFVMLVGAIYRIGVPVATAVTLYYCGVVMWLYSKKEPNREQTRVTARRMLYAGCALIGVVGGFILTATVVPA